MTSALAAKPGHVVVVVGELPRCDMCAHHRPAQWVEAAWDCATIFNGSWANLCEDCHDRYALHSGSGVGMGQRLIAGSQS